MFKADAERVKTRALFIILGGLPGTGKTTLARELARQLEAVWVRIDSIEQAIRAAGALGPDVRDLGYRVGYAVAEDNLRLGRAVIADSVNPLAVTRDAWLQVAKRAEAAAIEVEVKCSDLAEHRRRVETRTCDVPGLKLPTWSDVASREYHPWDRGHLVIDTSRQSAEECVAVIRAHLPAPWQRRQS
jgi:predicted kinase